MEWKPDFELGLPPMDETHREFVGMLNELASCAEGEFVGLLERLVAHTVTHFEQEATWMHACGFPPMRCHVGEHERVLKVVSEVLARVRTGDLELGRRLIAELPHWFEHHAATMDRALAGYIRSTGYRAQAATTPALQPAAASS
ncbi:MAG: Bacteriohemerythrin [Gammaproteobacteria bacterium]|nr:Bacteriohemerythrin [Gammaproteobacteria bacterium]